VNLSRRRSQNVCGRRLERFTRRNGVGASYPKPECLVRWRPGSKLLTRRAERSDFLRAARTPRDVTGNRFALRSGRFPVDKRHQRLAVAAPERFKELTHTHFTLLLA
jgi:hypothetical protein